MPAGSKVREEACEEGKGLPRALQHHAWKVLSSSAGPALPAHSAGGQEATSKATGLMNRPVLRESSGVPDYTLDPSSKPGKSQPRCCAGTWSTSPWPGISRVAEGEGSCLWAGHQNWAC